MSSLARVISFRHFFSFSLRLTRIFFRWHFFLIRCQQASRALFFTSRPIRILFPGRFFFTSRPTRISLFPGVFFYLAANEELLLCGRFLLPYGQQGTHFFFLGAFFYLAANEELLLQGAFFYLAANEDPFSRALYFTSRPTRISFQWRFLLTCG